MCCIPSVFGRKAPTPAVFNEVHPQTESSRPRIVVLYCRNLKIKRDTPRKFDELTSCNDPKVSLWFIVEDGECANEIARLGD